MPSLFDAVTSLQGVGKSRGEQLKQLHIHTLYDLISHFPRDYEDRTKFVSLDQLVPDQPVCFRGLIVSTPHTDYIREGLNITKTVISDNTARMNITFFNRPYTKLEYGREYAFYGALQGDFMGYQVTNPLFEPVSQMGGVTNCIVPIYDLTAGISANMMRKLIAQSFTACQAEIPDLLPPQVQRELGFADVRHTYEIIHNPPNFPQLELAKRRLIFEEFFVFSIGLQMVRSKRLAQSRPPLTPVDMTPLYQSLPFTLTNAQNRVVSEILSDFSKPSAMNRMLQGDVGSGKTAVAAAAAYSVTKNGGQVALMAPTEILAEQHHRWFSQLFDALGITAALLTGSLTPKEKLAVKQRILQGEVQLILGTHALITGDVAFQNLQLVIADEQHRFGVSQRAALADKGDAPHLLVMSATPIPRSLALILYGDLDVSILDELPPNRQTIDTFLISESKRQRMYNFVRQQIEQTNQVYFVCPAIEENQESNLQSAQALAEHLACHIFPDYTVGLLHGKVKPKEKEDVMGQFSRGELQILVSTTVVEVGVDVPNATLMVIENADRFGLSQLHQLRGRVGRGKDKSYCILISDNRSPETRGRLKTFCGTNNGFEIAQADLEIRGPGDFFGSRQSGLPLFKVANLACDLEILKSAQETATDYVQNCPNFTENKPLMERISALFHQDVILN